MSLNPRNSRLVFYAEGDSAVEYLNFMDDRGEAAVIDLIIGGKLMDSGLDGAPAPRDEDDETFQHDDGYTLVGNPRRERIWLYEPVARSESG